MHSPRTCSQDQSPTVRHIPQNGLFAYYDRSEANSNCFPREWYVRTTYQTPTDSPMIAHFATQDTIVDPPSNFVLIGRISEAQLATVRPSSDFGHLSAPPMAAYTNATRARCSNSIKYAFAIYMAKKHRAAMDIATAYRAYRQRVRAPSPAATELYSDSEDDEVVVLPTPPTPPPTVVDLASDSTSTPTVASDGFEFSSEAAVMHYSPVPYRTRKRKRALLEAPVVSVVQVAVV